LQFLAAIYAMPRYRLSRDDLADLISYLKRLDADQDPGLTDDCIKVGTILPSKGSLAELGQAIKRVLAHILTRSTTKAASTTAGLNFRYSKSRSRAPLQRLTLKGSSRSKKSSLWSGL
jgi:hypothetical protein